MGLRDFVARLSPPRKFYRYKVFDVGLDRTALIQGALCDWGKRGWRLVAIEGRHAFFEMDYYLKETWPEEQEDEDAV